MSDGREVVKMSPIKRIISSFGMLLLMFIIVFTVYPLEVEASNSARKIVVFKVNVEPFLRESLVRRSGGVLGDRLDIIHAIAVRLTPEAESILKQQPFVERIDDDKNAQIIRHNRLAQPQPSPGQTTPWNITKILATQAWSLARGTDVSIGIIDTGVSLSHPDLVVVGGINTIYPWRSPNDDNGHGSHVAGIACARDNSVGVVGVANECSLHAIKTLNAAGGGYISDIIEGIQWAVNNGMKVTNMSLGLSSDIQSFHDAITAAYNAGLIQVAAAGNNGPGANTTLFPAKYPEVVSVAATDSNDNVPAWSSRGKVDVAAPGVSIYSTSKGNKYATLSGTSMSSPHVAGVAALRKQVKPAEGPDQVKSVIQANTDSLPYDASTVGSGRVNAQKVVQAP